MKKALYTFLTIILMTFVIVSCNDDDTKPKTNATFTASKTTAKIGEEIQFTNTSENATAFKWSFGDGTTSKEISPKKKYSSGGKFIVSLLSTGAGGSQISSQEITIIPDPELYFTEIGANLIRHRATGTPKDIFNFLDVSGMAGVGLAYDAVHQKVYFSDYNVTGEGKIWRINLDGTDLEAIVKDLYNPYQIALDIEGGKVYWAESLDEDDIGHIGRANLDGTGKENIVSLADGKFKAIALDLDNDKVYYYDVNNEDLYRANLDGSGAIPILSGVYGYVIEVDEVNDRIYFDEQNAKLLLSADLDGGNIKTIDDNGSAIAGIAIDNENGRMYWTGWDSGTITASNLDGSHKVVVASGLSSPTGLFLKK